MKTDGYVKVDGHDLRVALEEPLAKLKYLADWQQAIEMEKRDREEKVYKAHEEKVVKIKRYLYDGIADQDFENALRNCEAAKLNFLAKFLNPKYYGIIKKDVMITSLQEANAEFWSEDRLRILEHQDWNYNEFKVKILGNISLDERNIHQERRFFRKTNYDLQIYLYFKTFSELAGEVYLNIGDYNCINKLLANPDQNFTNFYKSVESSLSERRH